MQALIYGAFGCSLIYRQLWPSLVLPLYLWYLQEDKKSQWSGDLYASSACFCMDLSLEFRSWKRPEKLNPVLGSGLRSGVRLRSSQRSRLAAESMPENRLVPSTSLRPPVKGFSKAVLCFQTYIITFYLRANYANGFKGDWRIFHIARVSVWEHGQTRKVEKRRVICLLWLIPQQPDRTRKRPLGAKLSHVLQKPMVSYWRHARGDLCLTSHCDCHGPIRCTAWEHGSYLL